MGLFDVHAHLTHPKLAAQQEQVLERARAAGVSTIISNGLNPDDNEAVLALAESTELVKPAFGLYPVDAVLQPMRAAGVDYPRDAPECSMDEGVRWVEDHVEQAFAIGEIGLDGHWVDERFWPDQERAFVRLVKLAQAANKAIIIHTRKRERRALELLQSLGAQRVNWHCFGGKVKLARQIAQAGHYLSIPANARRSQSCTRMLETLPREQLLLETDCPYLGPEPGTVNEPANVARTVALAAELWRVDVADVQAQMADNFTRLFGSAP